MKRFSVRLVIVLAAVVAAIVLCLPTFRPELWPHKKINLGLDLQGGMHLVLEVNTEKAVESSVERNFQEVRELVKKNQIQNVSVERPSPLKIAIQVQGKESVDKFKTLLDKDLRDLRISSRREDTESYAAVLDLPDKESDHIKKMSVDQALETIRNRVDQFGVSEPDIRRQGENRILIQLPGITDTQRAKDLIGRTALLEFKLVDEAHDLNSALQGSVPAGSEILYKFDEDRSTHKTGKTPFLLKKGTLLTGASLTDARVQLDSQYGEPYVSIEFDRKGARAFERVTGENVNKRLAIVLDNKVYSAPTIQERIAGGKARITGRFTMEEARDLAIILRAGALPAPVTILEERTVGPSLGYDSIRQGLIAMSVGGALLLIFMGIYYRLSGLLADFEVLLNVVLTGAGLAALGATLTLPGIAGTILSVGMALDNNILIYERIREELRVGKTPRGAVDAGFDRATLTILDANVTTLIAAAVLYQFGTGPVKGFAVTLSLGVVASIFTAVVVSRVVFDYILDTYKVKKISI
ncbi:MAG: protein translocase subunit SecD [Deltaproteobacteria bacterium]|nr:protein translocase subunit SecD [Deltaproteobacteria bacterium]